MEHCWWVQRDVLLNIFFRNSVISFVSQYILIRGLGGMPSTPPPINLFKMVQFGAFWCIFESNFAFEIFPNLPFLYIKMLKITIFYINTYFRCTLAI